jgi:hypothetical protein
MSISTDEGFPGSVKVETDLNDCSTAPINHLDGKVVGTQIECHLFGFKSLSAAQRGAGPGARSGPRRPGG